MGIDIYVMPLWRFKAGDFRSPIEVATGIRPKIITADGLLERPASIGLLERWRAKRQVVAVRKAVEAANRTRVRWVDDGDVVYSEQSRGMESLRAYARWLDCRDRLPEFDPPPEGDYYRHPVLELDVERLSCPHLVGHDCYNGYYLPCDFGRLTEVEPYLIYGYQPASHSVGSSVCLLKELDYLQGQLRVPEDNNDPREDPLVAVKSAYLQLREVAELSLRHALPIIFWG